MGTYIKPSKMFSFIFLEKPTYFSPFRSERLAAAAMIENHLTTEKLSD